MNQHHKHFLRQTTVILTLIVFLSFPLALHAAGTQLMGGRCEKNSDCKSGDCEKSAIKDERTGKELWFCDCDEISQISDSESCAEQYGGGEDDWHCVDGKDASWDLDYCQRDDQPWVVEFPVLPLKDPSLLDRIIAPSASGVADEIKNEIKKPQPRISIPGLTFTDPDVIKKTARIGRDGSVYLAFPFIGEYIAAAYRYALVAGTVLVLIMFLIGGFDWVTAKDKEKLENAKKRFTRGAAGLLLLLGSYVLLYSINPELVQFKSLQVLYVPGETIDKEGTPETQSLTSQGIGTTNQTIGELSCNFSALSVHVQKQQTFGKETGKCLGWVQQAVNNLCGSVPEALARRGAWDVAATWQKDKFHACDLEGIKDGDIVFMTSMGSAWITLWDNFSFNEAVLPCSTASPSKEARHYLGQDSTGGSKYEKVRKIEGDAERMPPVTHIGIYYQGKVYHLIDRLVADSVADMRQLNYQTRDKKPNWLENQINLSGNFIHTAGIFIAGYGTW